MKIAYISGVEFGFKLLEEILKNNFQISIVFSYVDSKKDIYSDYMSFDKLCKKYNIRHIKVQNINEKENVKFLKTISPDLILVMGWSQLLKNEIIQIPKYGIIGSHPTELPKFRGRAPIPWTILKNLKESALTFFYIENGVDNGDIIDQQKFEIKEYDDATIIYNKIIGIGKKMIVKNLKLFETNSINRIKQNESKFIEYWEKRTSKDGKINWNDNSENIFRLIRASTHPYPGAFTFYNKKKLKIFKARCMNNMNSDPGKILSINSNGVFIGTKKGIIILESVQLENDLEKNATLIFLKNDLGKILSF